MDNLKLGDVVKLKSGSMLMTIHEFDVDKKIAYVVYFTNNQELQYANFNVITLTKAE